MESPVECFIFNLVSCRMITHLDFLFFILVVLLYICIFYRACQHNNNKKIALFGGSDEVSSGGANETKQCVDSHLIVKMSRSLLHF